MGHVLKIKQLTIGVKNESTKTKRKNTFTD